MNLKKETYSLKSAKKVDIYRMKLFFVKYLSSLFLFLFLLDFSSIEAQESSRPQNTIRQDQTTFVWLGTYGRVRLGEKLYWDAQTHFRTGGYQNTSFVGRMTQIYNRHGLQYIVNERFFATVGPVLRLNFTPDPANPDFETLTLEPRLWHEYMFTQKESRFQIFHRLRFEHRFNRSNAKDNSEFIFRNRWRYKFMMNIPLNTPDIRPGTWFFTPDAEIIMQSGNPVVDSPLEDLRIQPILGYVASPEMKYTMSLMYTTGQTRTDGALYTERWIFRFNVYWTIDGRKYDKKIPETRFLD